MDRRTLLAGCGSAFLSVSAGCSAFGSNSDTPQLSLLVRNKTSESHTLDIRLFDANETTYSEANVYSTQIVKIPEGFPGQTGEVRENNIVESQPYIVTADLYVRGPNSNHYHYFPHCQDEDDEADLLVVEISTDGTELPYIEYSQRRC